MFVTFLMSSLSFHKLKYNIHKQATLRFHLIWFWSKEENCKFCKNVKNVRKIVTLDKLA